MNVTKPRHSRYCCTQTQESLVLFLFSAAIVTSPFQLEAAENDEFKEGRSIVLSAVHGVCLELKDLGANAKSYRAEDFMAGEIDVGVGKAHRKIGYGIGVRFNKDLPFKIDSRFGKIQFRVIKADDRKNGVTVVKVTGLGNRPELDVRFNYPIGDLLSARYVEQITPGLFSCKVTRIAGVEKK